MPGRSTLLLATILLQLLSTPTLAGESDGEPKAACDAQQGTCPSLVQRNATRTSKVALEITEKPKQADRPVHDAKVAAEAWMHSIALRAKFFAHRATLSLLHIGRIMGPTDGSAEAAGGSWFMFLATALLLLGLVAAGVWVMMYQDKRFFSASSGTLPRRSMPTATMGPSTMGSTARPVPPSSKAVIGAPRPAESRGPSTMPRHTVEPPQSEVKDQLFLCPELVVPELTECTLFVPRLQSIKTNSQVSIDDVRGVSVFRAEVFRSAASDGRRLVLSSPAGDVTFASCREARQGSSFSICGKDGKEFCELQAKDDGSFEVLTTTRQRLRFQGPSGRLNAVDDQQNLLALADPVADGPGSVARRHVRIGPLLDAGLFVICYLGIDMLQMDREKTPTFSGSRFV